MCTCNSMNNRLWLLLFAFANHHYNADVFVQLIGREEIKLSFLIVAKYIYNLDEHNIRPRSTDRN